MAKTVGFVLVQSASGRIFEPHAKQGHLVRRYACALLAGFLFSAPAAAQGDRAAAEVSPQEFAILPWGWSPPDLTALRGIKQAGFNLAGLVAPDALDAVAAAGLKAIVSDRTTTVTEATVGLAEGEINRRVRALTVQVGSHPALFGYYLRDEPRAEAFQGLARWSAAFREAAPKALPYINLLPNYATPEELGGTYEAYLENFVRIVKPPFLSYDNYSLMDDGSLRDGYFQNLETVRSVGLRHGISFWNVVLSNAHFHYAEPTQGGLSFQVFTSLAYGARGIGYYNYFTPSKANFRLAPIDQFGDRTPTWDLVRRMNLQILNLAPVLAQLRSVNVFHHPVVPWGCRGLDSSRFVAGLSGGDLLAGEFQDTRGRPAIVVVNKDPRRSTQFSVRFKTAGAIQVVNGYTGRTQPWRDTDAWLGPGYGVLLLLEP